MFKDLWHFVTQHKQKYVIIFIFCMLENILVLVPTRVVQQAIDLINSQSLSEGALFGQIALLIGAAVAAYGLFFVWGFYLFSYAARFRVGLRNRLFDKLLAMRTPFYDLFQSGDMITRFTNDVDELSELIGYGAMTLMIGLATILFVLPVMFVTSWWIALWGCVPIVVLGVLVHYVSTYQDRAVEKLRESVAELSSEVLEVVEGVRVVRAYGDTALGTARFQNKTQQLTKRADRIMVLQAMYGRLATFFLGVSTAAILGLGALAIEAGTATIGQVVALQMYAQMLMFPMWTLSDFVLVYQTSRVAHGKLQELLTTSDGLEADGTETVSRLEQVVFQDYSFQYADSTQPGLSHISLVLQRGETLGVVGKTGSGKTTFVRQFLRQYAVGSGQFLLNQRPIQEYRRDSVEALIGYVPQEHVLFSRNVADNIAVGTHQATTEAIIAAAQAAAFDGDVARMPKGYDTLVGEKGVAISGGQKQRLSIARALIKDAELLILDDSLSAVDARTERRIIETLHSQRQGKTNVIVAHRLSAVHHAHWVIVLDEGRIIEAGTPAQLLAQRGWYYEQYERQLLEEEEEAACR